MYIYIRTMDCCLQTIACFLLLVAIHHLNPLVSCDQYGHAHPLPPQIFTASSICAALFGSSPRRAWSHLMANDPS